MAYRGTHQDINMLMLYPWPKEMRICVEGGQLGRVEDLSWQQYMAMIGEHWEKTYRYPRHRIVMSFDRVTVREQVRWGQLWGLCVRALLERGYLDFQGKLHPPVPFADPPPEFRTWADRDADSVTDDVDRWPDDPTRA